MPTLPKPKDMELDRMLCIKAKRVLRNDFTISYNGKLYQIEDNVRARDVIVEERIGDSMLITHKDRILKYKEINKPTKAKEERKPRVLTVRKTYKSLCKKSKKALFVYNMQYIPLKSPCCNPNIEGRRKK